MRSILRKPSLTALIVVLAAVGGCQSAKPTYGQEEKLFLPGTRAQVWAVAPAINHSGQQGVDPLLQADLLFQQLQQVRGLTVIPVSRVVEVYTAMRIDKLQSEQQAVEVCDALGCDAIVVPTVHIFDPYYPPKFGASINVFFRNPTASQSLPDVHALTRQPRDSEGNQLPRRSSFVQVADMYDGQNGTVRDKLAIYATGRHDPKGPLKVKEYLSSMDRFVGFAYHDLIVTALSRPQMNPM